MLVTTGGGREARRRCSIHASAARAWALGAILALAIASFAAADGDASAAAEPVDPVETTISTDTPTTTPTASLEQTNSSNTNSSNTNSSNTNSSASAAKASPSSNETAPRSTPSPYFEVTITGLGQVKALHFQTFALPDAQTLRETGFKISLNAPGLQSVGVDFPPGAWPEDVKNPPTILVFEPTATMSKALQSEMKFAGPVIDFGPSITFRKTVTIKLPLVPGTVAPPEGSEYTAYFYNKDQNIWQKRKHYSQNPNYVDGYVPGETISFSPYGALLVNEGAERCGGGCIAGAIIGGLVGVVSFASVAFYCHRFYQAEREHYTPKLATNRGSARMAGSDY